MSEIGKTCGWVLVDVFGSCSFILIHPKGHTSPLHFWYCSACIVPTVGCRLSSYIKIHCDEEVLFCCCVTLSAEIQCIVNNEYCYYRNNDGDELPQ